MYNSFAVQVRCCGKLKGSSIKYIMRKYGIKIEKCFTVFREDELQQNLHDIILKEGDIIYFNSVAKKAEAVIVDNEYGKIYE